MFIWVARDKGSEWKALTALQGRGKLPVIPLIEAVGEPFLAQRNKAPLSPIATLVFSCRRHTFRTRVLRMATHT